MNQQTEHTTAPSQQEIEAQKQQLEQAPVRFEWTVRVPTDTIEKSIAAIGGTIFALVTGFAGYSSGSYGFALSGILLAVALWAIFRHLVHCPKIYHYQVTPVGIRYTIEEDIPEQAYAVVRGSAWFGAGLCLLAVAVAGPVALVGAGGFALMSVKFVGFEKRVEKYDIVFAEQYLIKTYAKRWIIEFNSIPFECYESRLIYCKPEVIDNILAAITPHLKEYEIKAVNGYRELGPA